MTPQDEWTQLVRGEPDPYFSREGMYCREKHGGIEEAAQWCCTRARGHWGLHVASTGPSYSCVTWGEAVPMELQLPEGF